MYFFPIFDDPVYYKQVVKEAMIDSDDRCIELKYNQERSWEIAHGC